MHATASSLRASLSRPPASASAGRFNVIHERTDPERETALMVAFRDSGSEASFTELYEATRSSILGWIVHRLAHAGIEADPLEMLQDTFVNVYRYAASFRESRGHSFGGWARTIAANVVRRARSRRGALSYQALPEGSLEPVAEGSGPVGLLERSEESEELRKAWALLLLHYAAAWQKLSDRDRLALTLIEVEGLRYSEVAERLGVGSSNMKMIVFRSRKRIRAHILEAMGARERGAERVLRAC